MSDEIVVKWHVGVGLVGCKIEDTITFDADATDDDITEVVRENVMDAIDWDWERVEEKE